LVDGLRGLRAPDDLSAVRVLRNRLVEDRLARRDNLFAATRRGRVPSAVDLTADFERAAIDWQPPHHDGPVLVIRSSAAAQTERRWERVTTGPFEAVPVDSGHVAMMLPPAVEVVATLLREAINEVEAPHRS
jgi:thioesterase domain-containing protein